MKGLKRVKVCSGKAGGFSMWELLKFLQSRNCQTLRVPQQSWGFTLIEIDAPLGVFGLQFRLEPTPLNDITANSQGGNQGVVAINTLATDPTSGLTELATEFVDASNQPFNPCSTSSAGESSKIRVSGRGGLPPMLRIFWERPCRQRTTG